MTVKEKIITLLDENKGSHISGEDMATKLSVTRSAVWKAIKSLQADGYEIDAVTNKGYSLSENTNILSSKTISKYLTCDKFRFDIHKKVTSTNSVARTFATAGESEWLVVIADEQTDGRGRYGRNFFSPSGTGIYMSILLRPNLSSADSVLITTAAAVAVSQAIESISGQETQIKWVNDILIDGKKVCGILTEASFSLENNCMEYVVLGIGINTVDSKEGFPLEIKDTATVVFDPESNVADSRNRLIAEILNRLTFYYSGIEQKTFVEEYKKRSLVIGKNILVHSQNNSYNATALDIDEFCRLKVRAQDGEEKYLSSGEICIALQGENTSEEI